ncbi:MAG: hypothetical protein ACETWR_12860 [Anaerolineae bacterium]
MEEKITFRTEIEFKGSIGELGKVVAALQELPIGIGVEWSPVHPLGCTKVFEEFLSGKVLDKVIEGMPRIKAEIIRGIRGGIRDPHLHIDNEVVLLDRVRFKEVVGQVAMELAGRLGETADYTETVGAIRNLMPGAA